MCRNESRIEPASSTASLSTAPVTGEEGASGVANYGAAVSLVTSQQTGGQEPVTTISYTPQDSTDPHAHHHHHDDHEKHRFVHSHRGELAGPIVSSTSIDEILLLVALEMFSYDYRSCIYTLD